MDAAAFVEDYALAVDEFIRRLLKGPGSPLVGRHRCLALGRGADRHRSLVRLQADPVAPAV